MIKKLDDEDIEQLEEVKKDIVEKSIKGYTWKCPECGRKIPPKDSREHLESMVESHYINKHINKGE